jgi:AcrR family transcriptional regulator
VPRQPKRRLSAKARRDRITEAAMKVFVEKGYESASFGEIAQAAGITRPVVYDHFRSKRELYLWLLERDRAIEYVTAHLKPDGSAEAQVRRTIDAFFGYAQEHPFAWRMLFHEHR